MCVYSIHIYILPPKSTLLFPGSGAVIFFSVLQPAAVRVDAVVCTLPSRAGGANQLSKSTFNARSRWICMKQCFTFLIKSLHRTESGKKGWCIKYRRTFFFFFSFFQTSYESNINHRFLAVQRVVPRQTRHTRLIIELFAALLAFIAFSPFFLVFLFNATRSE